MKMLNRNSLYYYKAFILFINGLWYIYYSEVNCQQKHQNIYNTCDDICFDKTLAGKTLTLVKDNQILVCPLEWPYVRHYWIMLLFHWYFHLFSMFLYKYVSKYRAFDIFHFLLAVYGFYVLKNFWGNYQMGSCWKILENTSKFTDCSSYVIVITMILLVLLVLIPLIILFEEYVDNLFMFAFILVFILFLTDFDKYINFLL